MGRLAFHELDESLRNGTLGRVGHLQLRFDRAQDFPRLGCDGVGAVGRHLIGAQVHQRFPQDFLERAGLKGRNDGDGLRLLALRDAG